MNVVIVSFWTLWNCVGSWFRRVRCISFWLSTAGVCFPLRCLGICSARGAARRYRVSVVAAVMVLQALEGLSDREAVQRLRRDIAWKAAAGLSLTDGGFHPTVLTLWRARLRASDRPERIFDAVREVVAACGVLANRGRRALDSTILHDAVATGDTVTMISSQIRRCRRLIPAGSRPGAGGP